MVQQNINTVHVCLVLYLKPVTFGNGVFVVPLGGRGMKKLLLLIPILWGMMLCQLVNNYASSEGL